MIGGGGWDWRLAGGSGGEGGWQGREGVFDTIENQGRRGDTF